MRTIDRAVAVLLITAAISFTSGVIGLMYASNVYASNFAAFLLVTSLSFITLAIITNKK
jgi:hypothetical protein